MKWIITLLRINISPYQGGMFEDDFPFPRWDILVPWKVTNSFISLSPLRDQMTKWLNGQITKWLNGLMVKLPRNPPCRHWCKWNLGKCHDHGDVTEIDEPNMAWRFRLVNGTWCRLLRRNDGTWMSQEVSKWLVNGLQPTYKWGFFGVISYTVVPTYEPFTNFLGQPSRTLPIVFFKRSMMFFPRKDSTCGCPFFFLDLFKVMF